MHQMLSDAVSGYAEHGSRVEFAGQRAIGRHWMKEFARPQQGLLCFSSKIPPARGEARR
jgi:hypothetical protein